MIRKILILIGLVLATAQYTWAELPTEKEVRVAVELILQERRESVQVKDAEMTWQSPICYLISYQMAGKLKSMGLKPFLCLNKNHMNIGIYAVGKDGKDMELVIDPTYRQFFIGDMKDGRLMARMFEYLNMPEVLVVPRKQLKSVLEGFPIQPEWKLVQSNLDFEHYFRPIAHFPVAQTESELAGLIQSARTKEVNLSK